MLSKSMRAAMKIVSKEIDLHLRKDKSNAQLAVQDLALLRAGVERMRNDLRYYDHAIRQAEAELRREIGVGL